MKILKTVAIIILLFSFNSKSFAETWNEPWQKEIIQNAEYFVLAKVLSHDVNDGVEVEIIKSFGPKKLNDKILINGFSLLQMTSSSGHGVHLDFENGQTIYFLLTKRADGNFAIPTPTSGYAVLNGDVVAATYRHSYHQALVPKDVFEMTYTAIWNYYKSGNYDEKAINEFINTQIKKNPAGFEKDEISDFFLQHVALETAYLLNVELGFEKIEKFILSENFHSRVSAIQTLSNTKNKNDLDFLLNYIQDVKNGDFEKVIAIWALSRSGKEEYIKKMKDISANLSEEDTGFGGNIMDPRVGTHFPSPKGAVEEL